MALKMDRVWAYFCLQNENASHTFLSQKGIITSIESPAMGRLLFSPRTARVLSASEHETDRITAKIYRKLTKKQHL
jgi:hypothetical protein